MCRFQRDVSSAVNASNSVRPISAMFLILSDLSHLLVRSAGDALIVPVIGLNARRLSPGMGSAPMNPTIAATRYTSGVM